MHKRGCLRWNINHGVWQLIIILSAGLRYSSLPREAAACNHARYRNLPKMTMFCMLVIVLEEGKQAKLAVRESSCTKLP